VIISIGVCPTTWHHYAIWTVHAMVSSSNLCVVWTTERTFHPVIWDAWKKWTR